MGVLVSKNRERPEFYYYQLTGVTDMNNPITPAAPDTYLVTVYEDDIKYEPVLAYEFVDDLEEYERYPLFWCGKTIEGRVRADLNRVDMNLMQATGLLQPSGRVCNSHQLFDDLDCFVAYAREWIGKGLERRAQLDREAELRREALPEQW